MKIKSWEDVDFTLTEIANQEATIVLGKSMADEAKAEIAELVPMVEEFVREHEADLQERALALPSGRVWLRKATRLGLIGRISWKKVLAALIEGKRLNLVRTKREVDKEALDQLSDERLGELRVRRITEDVFGYETA